MKRKTIFEFCMTGVLVLIFLVTLSQFNQKEPMPKVLSDQTPAPTGSILFVSNHTGNQDIYLMDLATLKAINLTNNPSDDMNPQVTTDGRLMAFYSNRDGDNEIYLMNLSDYSVTQLTNNKAGDYDPSFSPDGSLIVFKSNRDDGYGDVFIVNPGGEEKNLTSARAQTEEWDPVFSPDSTKIFFVSRMGTDHTTDEIFSMNIDGTEMTQLTNNEVPDWYPAISSKNGKLAFISNDDNASSDTIFLSDLSLINKQGVKNITGASDDPSWDANGDKIIFVNDQDGDYDLYQMSANGSNIQKIADTSSEELSPIYLP